jgi:hypothetical protein
MSFLVLVDGLDYVIATDGVTSMPTSTDAAWPSDIAGMTLLTNALVTPRGTISERARPLDGDLEVSGTSTFRLKDITPAAGSASGQWWLTYLGATRFSSIVQSQLTVSASATDATLTVDSTSGFASSGTLYINRETVTYSGTTPTTFTGCTRGKYGSRATQQLVNTSVGFRPQVWAQWSGFEGRRISWWHVDGSNVARLLWIGVVKNGPRLVSGDTPEAGAQWELQCEHVWNYEKQLRLGIQGASCRLVGVNAAYIIASARWPSGGFAASSLSALDAASLQPSLDAACGLVQRTLNDRYQTLGVDATSQLSVSRDRITHRLRMSGVGSPVYAAIYRLSETGFFQASTSGADPREAEAELTSAPSVVVWAPTGFSTTYALDTVSGLPTTWGPTAVGDSTVSSYVLSGVYDDRRIVIEPSATSSSPPSVTGQLRMISLATGRDIGDNPYGFRDRGQFLADPPQLRVMGRIASNRWLSAIRYGLTTENNAANPISAVDGRNYDFATYGARIQALTESSASPRVLYLDGSRSFGDIVSDQFKFQGVGLGIRNGRVTPFVFLPPTRTDTITALSSSSADLLSKSTWGRNPDGIINTVEIETDNGKVVVNDQLSIARFGQGRVMSLKLVGSDDPRFVDPDPLQVMQHVLRRVINLWSIPTYVRTVRLSLSRMHSLYIGDYVTLTEWLTPNGSGGRGPVAVTSQVIGKSICLDSKPYVELELLEYGQQYVYGYAPCARVESIAGGVLTIRNNGSTLGNSTIKDPSGSNLSTYSGTANDGGVTPFQAGDKVKLVKRNTTSVTEETGFTIQSTSPSGTALASTITVSPNPATVIGTDWYDVVFDSYSSPTTNMRAYAYVGAYSTRKINGSDDALRWAP